MKLKKAEPLKKVFEELDYDSEQIFRSSFMENYTDFETLEKLLEADDWLNNSGDIKHDVLVGDVDEFLSNHSEFETLSDMIEQALEEWWGLDPKNRRKHTRKQCNVEVTVLTGSSQFQGTLLDISRSGLRIESTEQIPNTRTINVRIPRGDKTVQVKGVIRWKTEETPEQIGVEILNKEELHN